MPWETLPAARIEDAADCMEATVDTNSFLLQIQENKSVIKTTYFLPMLFSLSPLQQSVRRVSLVLIPYCFMLILMILLATQFTELGTSNEILSLTSFATLLTLSALAFNWSRVSPSFTSERLLRQIYGSGIDLFIASLLALIATFFAWLLTKPGVFFPFSRAVVILLFCLHWIFLALALLLFLLALFQLLGTTGKILNERSQES